MTSITNNMDVVQQPVQPLFTDLQNPKPQIDKPSEPVAELKEKKKQYVKIESEVLQQILNVQNELKKELGEQKERFDNQDEFICKLLQERKIWKMKKSELKQELTNLKIENSQLIQTNETMNKEIRELSQANETMNKENKTLRVTKEILNQENKTLVKENKTLSEVNDAWSKEFEKRLEANNMQLQIEAARIMQNCNAKIDTLEENLNKSYKTTNFLFVTCSVMSIGFMGFMAWPTLAPVVTPVINAITAPVVSIKATFVALTAQQTLSPVTKLV